MAPCGGNWLVSPGNPGPQLVHSNCQLLLLSIIRGLPRSEPGRRRSALNGIRETSRRHPPSLHHVFRSGSTA